MTGPLANILYFYPMIRTMSRLMVFLLVFLSGLQSQRAYAQSVKQIKRTSFSRMHSQEPDSNYVKTYKNKLMIALVGTRKFQHITLSTLGSHDNLRYMPNNPSAFGAGFSYNWLSLDLTLKFPYLTRMYDKKGDTDIFRIRLGYNKPKIWLTTLMQMCRGFYIHNIQKFDPEWFQYNDAYPVRPDILNFSWYTSLYYSFNNRNITYQSSLGWEQRQKKSAGTFLLGGSVFANYLSADSSMVPEEFGEYFNEDMNLTEQFNLQYGINCGYVHTFLLSKYLYLSLCIYPGIHYQTAHQISPLGGKRDISGDFGSVTEARAVLGYNTDKYYGGVTFNEIGILHFPENTILTNGYAFLKFFVGRRFNLEPLFKNRRHSNS